MWQKINKDLYIYRVKNVDMIGLIKRENNNWQCYSFYSFGAYIYTEPCLFKNHAKKLVEMRLEEIPWKPYFWMGYKILGDWYKFKKNDYHCWKHIWTYTTKADAFNNLEGIGCFTSFIPSEEIIQYGFSFLK